MRETLIDIGKVNCLCLGTLMAVTLSQVETVFKIVLLLVSIAYAGWKFYWAIKTRKP